MKGFKPTCYSRVNLSRDTKLLLETNDLFKKANKNMCLEYLNQGRWNDSCIET